MECIICEKHKQNSDLMIYQDDYVCVYHYMPDEVGKTNYLGYYFVEMIRHFDGIENATPQELEAMIKVTKQVASALIKEFCGERVYTFILGDGVSHLHEHIVIKHAGTPKEYNGCRVDDWPKAPRGDYRDILKLNQKIRKRMEQL